MNNAALDQPSKATPVAENPPMMNAIVQHVYGKSPETVLGFAQVARPTIGGDHVLVRVAAASVDRGTWHIMTGMPYAMRLAGFGVRSPKSVNPGRALAGTVEAVGKNVTTFKPGDEVYGTCDGSFAEYVHAEVGKLAAKPANLTFEEAAAAPISGSTALQAVRGAKVEQRQTVLITGASGGVGSFAVQIAKAFGAEVTGVCSTAKMDRVRSFGADHIIDYTRNDFTAGDQCFDVILDIGGNQRLSRLRRVLHPEGTLLIVGGETGGRWLGGFDRSIRATVMSRFVHQTLGMLTSSENSADLSVLRDLIEEGHVMPVIDRSYSLRDTPQAIRYVSDNRATGKVAITV